MAKSKKLLNCDFLNESSFRSKVSNKGKLLFLYIYMNCDDAGFCGMAEDLVDLFNANDYKFHSQGSLDLIEHNYQDALNELLEKGLLYKFIDKHQNAVYLVRDYHKHNKLPDNRVTESNYKQYLSYVELVDNQYQWTKKFSKLSHTCDTNVCQMSDKCQTNAKPNKENRSKENIIEVNVNEIKDNSNQENESIVSDDNTNDDDKPF